LGQNAGSFIEQNSARSDSTDWPDDGCTVRAPLDTGLALMSSGRATNCRDISLLQKVQTGSGIHPAAVQLVQRGSSSVSYVYRTVQTLSLPICMRRRFLYLFTDFTGKIFRGKYSHIACLETKSTVFRV